MHDEFGPEKIIEVFDKDMHGFVVIDNTALGPAKGGIRMTPSVTVEEVARLARVMTWKNALAELPFGGGKAGVVAGRLSRDQKFEIIRSFSRAIKPVCPSEYIAGPDMNTGEEEMAEFVKANGSFKSATGKPAAMCAMHDRECGIPHELGSTGFGVFHAMLIAAGHAGIDIAGAAIAIEGFGNVGTSFMKNAIECGAKVVAVSDSKGCIYNRDGLGYEKLMDVKKNTGSVINYKPAETMESSRLFELPVDILVPAALPDSINKNNVNNIKAKVIVEAANIPAMPEIEEILHKRGVLVVPDIIANAGGVISSYAEYMGKNPDEMFGIVKEKIRKNTKLVLDAAAKQGVKPRDAAMQTAVQRVHDAMEKRRYK